jgi:hypothetical protein
VVDISTTFPRKYMSAIDLDGRNLTAQIVDVELKSFSTGDPVLMLTLRHNEPAPKMVRCNLTNRGILGTAWGTETDNWVGRKLELSVHETAMGPGIAMRPIEEAPSASGPSWSRSTGPVSPPVYPAKPAKPAKPGHTSRIEEDEVPF